MQSSLVMCASVSALRQDAGLLSILPVYLTVCNPHLQLPYVYVYNFYLTIFIWLQFTGLSPAPEKSARCVCPSAEVNLPTPLGNCFSVRLSVCLSVWLFDCATLEGVTARTLRWVVATLKFIIGKVRWCVRRSRRAAGASSVLRGGSSWSLTPRAGFTPHYTVCAAQKKTVQARERERGRQGARVKERAAHTQCQKIFN